MEDLIDIECEIVMIINTVTVIGVTGTMGANVAGIFASFGDAKVYCVGRNIDRVQKSIDRIVNSVRADSIRNKLIPADFSMLETCVSDSDLVFESAFESYEIKNDIAKKVSNHLRPHAISCTGTSGLSISEIATFYSDDNKSRFFGVHMFNPPYNMSLCELISTEYSDIIIKNDLKEYLEKKLSRTVVEVKDSPAFLGNRIGFQFINEALQFADKYRDNGGIDYIDSILGVFTGRAMAPIATADFVGLDIHKAIVDNIHNNTNDYANQTFVLPSYVQSLIDSNHLGRKSGDGLYKLIRYGEGQKLQMVYDIGSNSYREIIPYKFPFAETIKEKISVGDYSDAFFVLFNNQSQEAAICRHFLINYIIYALYASNEVAFNLQAADDVMATGFNWCPPIAMLNAFLTVVDKKTIEEVAAPTIKDKIDLESLLNDIQPSVYDYRRFFRSGR